MSNSLDDSTPLILKHILQMPAPASYAGRWYEQFQVFYAMALMKAYANKSGAWIITHILNEGSEGLGLESTIDHYYKQWWDLDGKALIAELMEKHKEIDDDPWLEL